MANAGSEPIQRINLESYLTRAIDNNEPPCDWYGMLRCLRNIDAGEEDRVKGMTLLHAAVRVGSLPWVRALLALGADPLCVDGNASSALQLAEQLAATDPRNIDRVAIYGFLNLVRNGGVPVVTPTTIRVPRKTEEMTDESRVDIASVKKALEAMGTSTSNQISSIETTTLKEIQSIRKDIEELRALLKKQMESTEAFRSTANLEMKHLRDISNHLSNEISAIKETSNQMNSLMLSQELKMSKVDEIQDEVKSLKTSLNPEMDKQMELSSRILKKVDPNLIEMDRQRTIEALMSLTQIHEMNDANVAHVRGLYDKLYSLGPLVSILMRFLSFRATVKIIVDCDSDDIGRIIENFVYHDGKECDVGQWRTFTDLEKKSIYLAGLVDDNENKEESVLAFLAQNMSMMCDLLMFENGGRPYSAGDVERRRMYEAIIKEVEERT